MAIEQGDARVTIGADLDEQQRAQVYADFGIKQGEVTEIKVTNADERAYLEGIAPEKKIGKSRFHVPILSSPSLARIADHHQAHKLVHRSNVYKRAYNGRNNGRKGYDNRPV